MDDGMDVTPQGKVKATRDDWLNVARDVLVSEGVESVKVLTLAGRLGVSRSSFYWYFGSRDELLAALLEDWAARNTGSIEADCALPSRSANEGLCNFFRSFIEGGRFDPGLDFAIREWARRNEAVRAAIDAADAARLRAVRGIFARHGFGEADADARARIVYFMQLGYHALDVREDMETRMARVASYLHGFTGQLAGADDMNGFFAYVGSLAEPVRTGGAPD
jgi:AcrR family transcriptional regulator